MPCRVAATPYPAYEIIVQSLVNAGWHYVYPAYKIVFSAFVGPVSVSATGHFFSGSAFSADR